MDPSTENLQELVFRSSDGIQNKLLIARQKTISSTQSAVPKNSGKLILCVPAMGVSAKQYIALINSFAKAGINAACFDLRGNGNSSVRAHRSKNFGYAELVEQDLPAAISSLLKEFGSNQELILFGHSLGGQVCSLYLSQNPSVANTLILTASCSVHYKSWPFPYRWGLLAFSQFAFVIAVIVGYFPGRNLGFGGREARSVMKDWAYNARTGNYRLSGSRQNYTPFRAIKELNVLSINFDDDELAPVSATNQLLTKINARNTHQIFLSGSDIGRSNAGHFNWLRSPQRVSEEVAQFIADRDK